MCTGNKMTENTGAGCRGKCADLAQAKAPEAEVLKQKNACHGDQENADGTAAAQTGSASAS